MNKNDLNNTLIILGFNVFIRVMCFIAVCIGTNGRMSVPSNREHHYRNLKDRYSNCTYVDGNLELTWLQDENFDLSFLQYIREVSYFKIIRYCEFPIILCV